MRKPNNSWYHGAVALSILASPLAHAGAFSLYTEGSATTVGNYAAGAAAEASDAATAWYNPAGLVFLNKQQLLLAGTGVAPNNTLNGTSIFRTTGLPSYQQNFSNLSAKKNAIVPALHYAQPLSNRAAFGFSLVSPFGLATRYPESSPVRYAATLSELKSVDFSPSLAGQLNEQLLLGAGLDFQWSEVKYNLMLGAPTLGLVGGQNPNFVDSSSQNKGNSFGMGFHAGLLALMNDKHSRLGLNFQSNVKHTYRGESQLTGRLAAANLDDPNARFISNNLFSNDIDFPQILTLSGYHDLNADWAILASAVFTAWTSLQDIQLNQVAAFSENQGTVLANADTPQRYRNAWRFALGANYRLTDRWLLRMGTGYDQTPTNDAYRDVRLPDADRLALSIGGRLQATKQLAFDAGYTHLFGLNTVPVNQLIALGADSSYQVRARAKAAADLLALQGSWTFDA